MKRKYLYAIALLLSAAVQARAQCPFTPGVSPDRIILCPDETDTLWTEQYESYQWFKNGNLIPGGTLQYYVVEHYRDAGGRFSVEATLDGCTARSDEQLVDGWAFLGLSVSARGSHKFDGNRGRYIICDSTSVHDRDSLVFTLNPPYNTNIKWYLDGTEIPLATASVYRPEQTGTYHVTGSPVQCPGFVAHLGVPLNVEVVKAEKPLIRREGDELIAYGLEKQLRGFQWYIDSVAVPGANDSMLTPGSWGGIFTVSAGDGYCSELSDPYTPDVPGIVGTSGVHAERKVYPNPAKDKLFVQAAYPVDLVLTAADGRVLKAFWQVNEADLSGLPDGIYLLGIYRNGMLISTERIAVQAY